MGQAWCKEKSTKAQDSKSPLDRVFVRCAHRIYPGLKEEGSVLGGATQRVTSSEIGYASSPPREALARGQSIDSVDRPFHPSDWVDVNLEVPGTPRANSAMTNVTLDTTLYPSTTHVSTNSSGSNLRDFTPVPPPRRRKKNRGRPLPAKPDQASSEIQIDRVTNSERRRNSFHEPLYSWIKALDPTRSNKIDIYEHKVNGTGRIIPSTVVAGNRSSREKSSRSEEEDGGEQHLRPKNKSTVSLPNYRELEVASETAHCEDEEELKIHKITAAGSLPALITSGGLENIMKSDSEKRTEKNTEAEVDKDEAQQSFDEVDFSFDVAKNLETLNHIYKREGPRLTSTPVKNGFENDSRTATTVGGWFLHQDRDPLSDDCENCPRDIHKEKPDTTENSQFYDAPKSPRSNNFFKAEEDLLEESKDNHASGERGPELESGKPRRRTSLRRRLSNESEPFDSYEEKELRESALAEVRSNSQVKLVGRSISEESLPAEMLVDPVETSDSLENEEPSRESNDKPTANDEPKKKQQIAFAQVQKSDDTKTPPPSPEPKIKPEIFDNDHSTLLKVLRDEAEESNLSSMTPSLTELEAALSDMLEREDENHLSEHSPEVQQEKMPSIENSQAEKILEEPIEPKIVQIDMDKDKEKHSGVSVSLKNILGGPDDKSSKTKEKFTEEAEEISKLIEIDLSNGNNLSAARQHPRNPLAEISVDDTWDFAAVPAMEPPEKPSRLHQVSLGRDASEVSEKVPTPPRRRNRSSVGVAKENVRRSIERAATPENPYPNDRLI